MTTPAEAGTPARQTEEPARQTRGRRLGRYRLIEQIGRGGMAEIWRASLEGVHGFERELVIKRILPEYAAREAFLRMFVHEAKLSSQLNHPNIAGVYELGEADGTYFIAMEYVKGWDLLSLLTHGTRMRERIPLTYGLFIVSQICRGLACAHAAVSDTGDPLGIVHMDVSPSNVLIGAGGRVKLADFGVAKARLEGGDRGPPDRLRGKAAYMSPEQVLGQVVDHRSDLFSAGVVLFETLTLKRLFKAPSASETLENVRRAAVEPRLQKYADVPDGVKDILRKALARNPEDRYATGAEMASAIDQYLSQHGHHVTGQEVWEFVQKLCTRSQSTTGPVDTRMAAVNWGTPDPDYRDTRRSLPAEGAESPPGEPAVFTFQNEDGSAFGAVSFQDLARLLVQRAVLPDDRVRVGGGPWRKVCEVPVLFDVVEALRLPETTQPTESGEVDQVEMAATLLRFPLQQATGRLRLGRKGCCKDIFFKRGKITHISTNRKDELLGPFLVSRGILTAEEVDQAFRLARVRDQALGEAVVLLRLLSHMELVTAVEAQLRQKLLEVFTWPVGHFAFYAGERPGPQILPLNVEPLPTVSAGIRVHLATETLRGHLGGTPPPLFRQVESPPFDVEGLALSGREHRLYLGLEGRPRSLRVLLRECATRPGDEESLIFVLFLLSRTGHLRLS